MGLQTPSNFFSCRQSTEKPMRIYEKTTIVMNHGCREC